MKKYIYKNKIWGILISPISLPIKSLKLETIIYFWSLSQSQWNVKSSSLLNILNMVISNIEWIHSYLRN